METEKITKSLYDDKVKIVFYPDSHRYKLEGSKDWLISATACTGVINKPFLIPWAVGLAGTHLRGFLESTSGPYTADQLLPVIDEALRQHQIKKEEAASVGHMVHAYAEAFALAIISRQEAPNIPEDADEKVKSGINAFLKWFVDHDVKFIMAERMVYSMAHGFVGITDAIATVDGKKMVIDWKTSKAIYAEHQYQVAAYRMAYEEESGIRLDGALIVHFDKETGDCDFKELTDEDHNKDSLAFLACLSLKKREKELAKK
jgi:hypothetical protein